jgi:hypothetical protein
MKRLDIPGIALTGHDDGLGFDLEGDTRALTSLANALADADSIQIQSDAGPATINLIRSGELLVMRHQDTTVELAGSQASLDALAATLRNIARGPASTSPIQFHAHVEWYEGHPWLNPSSEPVVIYLAA